MGGARKVVRISEIGELNGEVIAMRDLFEYQQIGIDENRAAKGPFWATGELPDCLGRLEASGIAISPDLFTRRMIGPMAAN